MRLSRAVRRDVEANGDRATAAVKFAAMELAKEQLADLDLRTDVRYIGIAKTIVEYMECAGPKSRKRAKAEAAKYWRVNERTVEYALAYVKTAEHTKDLKRRLVAVGATKRDSLQ